MEEKRLIVINDDGTEQEMEILFTFDDDQFNKRYVLYVSPEDETGEVFVSSYTEDGNLNAVTDEKEWAMIEEVFNAFVIQTEEAASEGTCACGHDHSDGETHECTGECGHDHNH